MAAVIQNMEPAIGRPWRMCSIIRSYTCRQRHLVEATLLCLMIRAMSSCADCRHLPQRRTPMAITQSADRCFTRICNNLEGRTLTASADVAILMKQIAPGMHYVISTYACRGRLRSRSHEAKPGLITRAYAAAALRTEDLRSLCLKLSQLARSQLVCRVAC